MPKEKYTEQLLIKTAKVSRSYRDLSIKVGAGSHGGAIQAIKTKTIKYGIDTSHFQGQKWSLGNTSNKQTPISEVLSIGKEQKSYKLKRSLLALGIAYQCAICKITEWSGKAIDLQVDHINGDRQDNRNRNLRFLCPNCHSQTDTYCFRGRSHDQTSVG